MTIPLGGLRAIASGTWALPDVCTLQRYTETVTGDGTSQSWSDLATGVACRVSRIGQGGAERLGGDQSIQSIGQRRITLPFDQDVTVKDRIVTGGVTYEVSDAPDISNDVAQTVICREIT